MFIKVNIMQSYHYYITKGWMGDPNGLVYHNGTYHLFYQYEPKYNIFTPDMHWGHATSNDLVSWQERNVALAPDEFGPIWSGSSVVDTKNVSGLGNNVIIAFYTSAGSETYQSEGKDFTVSMAYSLDGIQFTKYMNNPIVSNITRGNRDPKVFQYCDKWIMIMSLNNQSLQILHSDNLIDWTKHSVINTEFINDCPDIMHINDNNFLLFGTNGKYVKCQIDNELNFTIEPELHQFALGETYSSQIWNNCSDNIIIFRLGDMEDSTQKSQMSVPIILKYSDKLSIAPVQSILDCFTNCNEHLVLTKNTINKKIDLNTCKFLLDISFQNVDQEFTIELIDGDRKSVV